MSVIEGDRLLERFSLTATRGVGEEGPPRGACPANNKYSTVQEIQKTKERGNKESKDSCKAKASKQTSQIWLRSSLPVYFLWGHFNVSALAKIETWVPGLQCYADNIVIPVTRAYAFKWCFEM